MCLSRADPERALTAVPATHLRPREGSAVMLKAAVCGFIVPAQA